jgi:NhaA family Na+:H+ antiporter
MEALMSKVVKVVKNKMRNALSSFVSPVQKFINLEASSGIFLFVVAIIAMIIANSEVKSLYFSFINTPVSVAIGNFSINKTLLLLVNDGLMAIFFYLVGLEIKKELLVGELSTPRKAAFSFFGALGGMAVPALIYVYFNLKNGDMNGWGVPMATDIAFALGIISLLGNRVSSSVKIFLLSLAIVDDLGAILVIAIFYTGEISTNYLGIAAILLFVLYVLNKSGFRNIAIGLIIGFFTWFCFLKSGIHATLAGVILAFLTPARSINKSLGSETTQGELLLDKYIHNLHPWSAFVIMPIFAFFNAGVNVQGLDLMQTISHPVTLGIVVALVVGKPLGVFLFTFLASKLKLSDLPKDANWMQIIGVGCIAGIGFTMSLFISSLAFDSIDIEKNSKIGIVIGSLISMILGYSLLLLSSPKKENKMKE